jgi:prophage antirepressor-like protein
MKNQTQLFENKEFGKLEVLTICDKPYFPATDCARILGYKNPRDAIAKHCKSDGVAKRDGVAETTNQHGKVTKQCVEKIYITEGNLYRLIVRSKLPSAEKFSDWIFEEVMPAIRKYGAYITENVLKKMLESSEYTANLLKNLSTEYVRNQKLECKIMELTHYQQVKRLCRLNETHKNISPAVIMHNI